MSSWNHSRLLKIEEIVDFMISLLKKSWDYCTVKRNHDFYGKVNIFSVKSTKKLLKSWFHEIFWVSPHFIVFFHTQLWSVNLHWSIAHLISWIYSCNYKRPKQRSIFQKNVKATIIVPKLSIDCRFGLSLNDLVQDIFFLDSVFRREVNVDLAFQSHILENAYHFVVSMMA